MKRIFIGFICLFLSGCRYSLDDIRLGLGFMAKETCSCAFVIGKDENFCKEYGDLNAIPVSIAIDSTTQATSASFLWFWKKEAHLVSPTEGCRLNP